MGAPAARLGDLTSHGTPLGPGIGCLTVLIGGQPAWRVGIDAHVCAADLTGGVVASGSVSVLIGGMPAARVGDAVQEPVGPNTIVVGDFTVLIG